MGILRYLSMLSPAVAEVCKPFWKLTSVKVDWAWNIRYQGQYGRAKKIIKKDVCMKFYGASGTKYLEADTAGVSLGARLLQVRDVMNCGCDKIPDNITLHPSPFASKSLIKCWVALQQYRMASPWNTTCLEMLHHHCFAKEVCLITDHNPLVALISKGVATLPQHLQHIILCIYQYRVCIIYKPSPGLHIVD